MAIMIVSLAGVPVLSIGLALISLIGIPSPLAAGAAIELAMIFVGRV